MLGEHAYAGLRPALEPGFRGMVRTHQTDGLWQFVCMTCGYLEMYLIDPAALGFVAQNWSPVPSAPQ